MLVPPELLGTKFGQRSLLIIERAAMEKRTIHSTATFTRPFRLPGVDSVLPAGTYNLNAEEEKLDTISIESWRRTVTTLQVTTLGVTEHVAIDPQDLREALLRDGDLSVNTESPVRPRLRGQLHVRSRA